MTRFYFMGALLLFSAISLAQTEKGRVMVSGRSSLDFTYSKTKTEGGGISAKNTQDTYNFNISPAVERVAHFL